MEPLIAQLQKLPGALLALPARTMAFLVGVAAVVVALVLSTQFLVSQGRWEYVFTQLSSSDSTACGDALKAAGVPFRIEANGEAIAVQADKVHEARLLLAGQGLPRQSGIGFELFDKSDLGVSEITQRVNLQRATEGELARTVSSLAPVREARVHVTLAKKGLFRDDDKGAQAAVLVKLHPGRVLDERALQGIKNLVAAAVPGLTAQAVSIIDGSGNLLGEAAGETSRLSVQRKFERSLEEQVIAVLEPILGRSAVVATVSADLDDADEGVTRAEYDPDGAVFKSERTNTEDKHDRNGIPQAIVGAAANTLVEEPGATLSNERTNNAKRAESIRTWEVSGTVTHRTARSPRLRKLSVAIVVDEKTPRSPQEVAGLRELAKRAVGFDEDRGDMLELSSVAFLRVPEEVEPAITPSSVVSSIPDWVFIAGGILVAIIVLLLIMLVVGRGRARAATAAALDTLPSATSSFATARVENQAALAAGPLASRRQAAISLALADPKRASQVLETWLDAGKLEQPVNAEGQNV